MIISFKFYCRPNHKSICTDFLWKLTSFAWCATRLGEMITESFQSVENFIKRRCSGDIFVTPNNSSLFSPDTVSTLTCVNITMWWHVSLWQLIRVFTSPKRCLSLTKVKGRTKDRHYVLRQLNPFSLSFSQTFFNS